MFIPGKLCRTVTIFLTIYLIQQHPLVVALIPHSHNTISIPIKLIFICQLVILICNLPLSLYLLFCGVIGRAGQINPFLDHHHHQPIQVAKWPINIIVISSYVI